MMIKYINENGYDNLYDDIQKNVEYYSSGDASWLDSYSVFIKESRIDASLPNLDANNDDIVNVINIYNALKDRLSPRQASNKLLWVYMTHFEYWNYTYNRWKKEELTIGTIKDRFFCGGTDGSRRSLLRNAISRLWWIGYVSYDENNKDHYKLTRLLCSNSDLLANIIERNFSMNKNVTVGILKAISEINDNARDENHKVNREEWRAICKYVNKYGGVTMLDFLSEEQVKELCITFIDNKRNVNKTSKKG